MNTQPLCPHCNKPLKKSRNKEYAFECLNCDEDFYEFETIKDTEQCSTTTN
jgi:ribosomal protein L37AE/L43A